MKKRCLFRSPRFQRLSLEQLESRIALTSPTVVSVDPLVNAHTSPVTGDVSAVFDQAVLASTVTDQTFGVQGAQSGLPANSITASGSNVTLTLAPDTDFFPGELVHATLTAGVTNPGGESAAPLVWQFRTETAGGSGFFEQSDQTLAASLGYALALGDLDGDTDLDVFIVGKAADEVWLNDGLGNFSSNGQSLENVTSRDVKLADLDDDSDLDAFVVGLDGGRVWINDGAGQFTDSGQDFGNFKSEGVALGDVDGDGHLDAFVAIASDFNSPDFSAPNKVWLNDGNGQFVDSGQELGDMDSQAVALADLNGDGVLDAFVVNSGFFGNQPNKVWLNNGTGTFVDSEQELGQSTSADVTLADVDDDDDIDAVVVGAGINEVWLNDGAGGFSTSRQLPGENTTGRSVAVDDLDGDGDLDVFIAMSGLRGEGAPNDVWLNDGEGNFDHSGQALGNSVSWAVALGDLDGDGYLDAMVGNEDLFFAQADQVWLNDGSAQFTESSQRLGFPDTYAVAFGDLDGDNDLDVVVGNSNTASQVWRGGGRGSFDDTGQRLESFGTRGLALGDLDGDGYLDAFFANSGNESNQVWINDGDGNLTHSGQILGGRDSWDVDLGDVDGDGDLDAFVANAGGQPNTVWLNDGSGQFTKTVQLLGGSSSLGVQLGDLDGDGDLDAFVANGDNEPNRVWRNDGTGAFTDSGQILGASSGQDVALGDLDGDSDLDAFVANAEGESDEVWRNDGDGRFDDTAQSLATGLSRTVTLGDLDADGDLDAFVAGTVNSVWTNVAGNFVRIQQDLGGDGARSVALGDADNDGDLDAWVGYAGDASRLWLNLDTPPLVPDAFEPNESFATAASLDTSPFSFTGQLQRTVEMLTIHEAGDEDWYKWTAPEDGQLTADLVFLHEDGDADLSLFNASEILLTLSNSETDNEQVVYPVTGGETYYIQVTVSSISPTPTQPNYDLIVQGSEFPPDVFEGDAGNDTIETASQLEPITQTHSALSIHNSGNDDWFQFTAESNATLQVDVSFADSVGDLDLRLVAANETELALSSTGSDNEQVIWEITAGQTYFIQVFGFEGDTSPQYDLRIDTGNTAPTISEIADRVIDEDSSTGVIPIVVDDAETVASDLVVSGSSSNKSLVPDGNIVFGGSGSNRTATVTPVANLSGSTVITVRVIDTQGATTVETFSLSVRGVNDPPVINSPSATSVPENSTSVMTVVATDIDNDSLTFAILPTVDGDFFTINAATGALRFVTAPDFENPADANANNVYEVDVTADDGHPGGVATQRIRVSVTNEAETAPTVDIVNVSPDPRAGAVSEITIRFSEPVSGFDLSDLQLTRSDDDVVSLLPGFATLTSSDLITWTLGNLSSLTAQSGVFELTLAAAGSGIQNTRAVPLATNAADRWINGAGDANGDLQFDQLDLVQVLRARKYLTGEPATWSQGDWNGDGVFNQFDIVATQQTTPRHYLQGPFGATSPGYDSDSQIVPIESPAATPVSSGDDASTEATTEPPSPAVTDAAFAELAPPQTSVLTVSGELAKRPIDDAWRSKAPVLRLAI